MRAKVTLKELVGTRIVYALLLGCYYWMWARRDWHSYYETVQNTVVVFTVVFFLLQAARIRRYNREEKDELAIQNLRGIDAIGLKLMVAAAILIAFPCAVGALSAPAAGYALVGAVFVWTVLRFVLFCLIDSRGGLMWPLKRGSGNTGKKRD